jgi:AhpD family alkylhydroperoxidase
MDEARIMDDKQKDSEEVPCCADAATSAASAVEGSDIAQIKAKFKDFLGAASSPHGLDAYTKQAIAIALSVATRCEPCLKMHLKNAKKKGFTQDEIDEAAWMGISFGGSPTMVFYEQNKEK